MRNLIGTVNRFSVFKRSRSTKEKTPFCALQSLGAREEQEDSYGICYDYWESDSGSPKCFILADGMGGHVGGSVASQMAVDAAKLSISETKVFGSRELMDTLSVANASVSECLSVNPEFEGMGTTLVVTAFFDGRLFWLSIGDSPLFGINSRFELARLNEDHSMKPVLDALVETGDMNPNSDEYRRQSNQLRSALMGDEIDLYELNDIGVPISDWKYFLMASDGLETLSQNEIESVVKKNSKKGPDAIGLGLIDAVDAKHKRKQDNVTLIVLEAQAFGR